jgi:transcriptional regulator with XRE-family HTH domain
LTTFTVGNNVGVMLIRTERGPCFSRGSELLAIALDDRTLTAFAAEIGASKGMVSTWLSGSRRPSLRWATAIERAVRIPPEAWLEAPHRARRRQIA